MPGYRSLHGISGCWNVGRNTGRKYEENTGDRWVPTISGNRDKGLFKAWVNMRTLDAHYRWNGRNVVSQMEQGQDTEY